MNFRIQTYPVEYIGIEPPPGSGFQEFHYTMNGEVRTVWCRNRNDAEKLIAHWQAFGQWQYKLMCDGCKACTCTGGQRE